MVGGQFWWSWTIVIISTGVTCVMLVFLLYCICWERKKLHLNRTHHYFNNNSSMQLSAESPDPNEKFKSAILQLEISDAEEVMSCTSTDSKNTFYSTNPSIYNSITSMDYLNNIN